MDYLYCTLMLLACCYCIVAMYTSNDGRYHLIGVVALFSIGYYVLPVIFKDYSGLDRIEPSRLAESVLMCLSFFLSMIIGNTLVDYIFRATGMSGFAFGVLDENFVRHRYFVFIISYICWISYVATSPLTSYGSDDIDTFFLERDQFSGTLSAIAGYALGAMATVLALEIAGGTRTNALWMGTLFISCIASVLFTAQRLAVITPVFTLVAALAVCGASTVSRKLLFGGIAFLVAISPLMVFVREFQANGISGQDKFNVASGQFDFGEASTIKKLLLSIMQRADLLEVVTYLKDYIDATGHVSAQYFQSVIYSFVPRLIAGPKPFPLSDDGTVWGSISVIAWNLLSGNGIGSLSAFGAISAYWEGGWIWLPINGFLTGATFALIFRSLGYGSILARCLFASIFVTVCVRNVPPSFFELIVALSSNLIVIILLLLLHLATRKRLLTNPIDRPIN